MPIFLEGSQVKSRETSATDASPKELALYPSRDPSNISKGCEPLHKYSADEKFLAMAASQGIYQTWRPADLFFLWSIAARCVNVNHIKEKDEKMKFIE